ncbi:hypothetical protein Ancab_011124 [Ancistrocladus abbreviatus]
MERRFRTNSFIPDHDDPQSSSENGSESPLSGDDSRATATTAPSSKKSRRSIKKRVVAVSIGDIDGSSRSKGEAYPPSDSWAWRKYGQKPIKGSPYPRGYYRCSSSKGCPARKQVERSRVDPTMLIITYVSDHNHPFPTSKHHHHHQNHHQTSNYPASAATTTTKTPSPPPPTSSTMSFTEEEEQQPNVATTTATLVSSSATGSDFQSEEHDQLFTDFGGNSFLSDSGGLTSWLSDVSLVGSAFVGPKYDDVDIAMFPIISGGGSSCTREEDESLFADLGELPECSAVFLRGGRGFERCNLGAAAPLCGSTGCDCSIR